MNSTVSTAASSYVVYECTYQVTKQQKFTYIPGLAIIRDEDPQIAYSSENKEDAERYFASCIPKIISLSDDTFSIHEFLLMCISQIDNSTILLDEKHKEMTAIELGIEGLIHASGMSIKEFSEYFHIPYRSIQDWKSGRRKCPDYLIDLLHYKMKNENIII